MSKTGILLTNIGSPSAPTPKAVRRYLREFLSDKKIVSLPRLIWLPILYGLILPIRPSRSAQLYQKIWTDEGAPLIVNMQKISDLLQLQLTHKNICISLGMHYGSPSIKEGLEKLKQENVDKIIVLPLFPQYSSTTTASTFEKVNKVLNNWEALPSIYFLNEYADHPAYIQALSAKVRKTWEKEGKKDHLLISFHGIPERLINDPYATHCEQTAKLLAAELNLSDNEWTLCYQSQFGYAKWLQPSTQDLFQTLPQKGIKHIDILCPGFAVDCLETLEEIAIRGKEMFIEAGGSSFQYTPALNDEDAHIKTIASLINH